MPRTFIWRGTNWNGHSNVSLSLQGPSDRSHPLQQRANCLCTNGGVNYHTNHPGCVLERPTWTGQDKGLQISHVSAPASVVAWFWRLDCREWPRHHRVICRGSTARPLLLHHIFGLPASSISHGRRRVPPIWDGSAPGCGGQWREPSGCRPLGRPVSRIRDRP